MPELLRTLLGWVEVLAPALTRPGFSNALVIFCGWAQTQGPHAVTEALVVTGVAGARHHEAFHRFFSRGTWKPDELGHLLFNRIVSWLVPEGIIIELVLDDTLAIKKGPTIFGLGSHLDPVRSTKKHRVFAFGHVWVVLSVVVHLPFSSRPWALPVLFRLYRQKAECRRHRGRYLKKTELARELLHVVASWVPDRHLRVSADIAYSNDTVLRGLPENIHFVGAMRPDAVLTAPPTDADRKKTGRRRRRGQVLPKPMGLAKSAKQKWQRIELFIYGRMQTIEYKTLDAQWYRGAGIRLLRVVVVRLHHGRVPIRVFFSTDVSMSVPEVLSCYAGRWTTETCFRNLKQLLGFGDSQARKRAAVERVAPFVGFIYTTLVLWFADGVSSSPVATPPLRPWYRHKRGMCFADVLRAAQRVLAGVDVLDLARDFDNLRKRPAPAAAAPITPERRAA